MLVKDWMSKEVITVDAKATLQQAIDLLIDYNISRMPVMEEGKLVGIVTDRDLKRASPSDATALDIQRLLYHLSRLEVGAIMSRFPVTVPMDYTLEETAQILLENNISGCPVVDAKGGVCGMITKNDLFKAMISLSGLTRRGIQFGFLVEDKPGSIKQITDIIRKYEARLVSIMSSYEKAPEGYRYLYVRAFNVSREHLEELKMELREKARMLYMVDLRDNTREIYE